MTLPDSAIRETVSERNSLEPLTRRVVRRSRLSFWAGETARLGLSISLLVAAVLLVARSVFGVELAAGTEWWIVVAASWAVASAGAWWRAGSAALTSAEAALWLDLRSDASGRVVTASEIDEASALPWRRDAEQLARAVGDVPSIQLKRPLLALALSAAALVATQFVPLRAFAGPGNDGITAVLEERLAVVAEKLEVLDEVVVLEEEERAELEASLDRMEDAIQDDPDLEATYEALDRLEEQLADRAEEALAQATLALRELAEEQEHGQPLESATSERFEALEHAGLLSKEQLESLLGDPSTGLQASPGAFKAASELGELSDEQLAMLGLCPDCGEQPCDKCKATGEP